MSHSSCGIRIQEQLSWPVLAQGISGGCSHLRTDWGWRTHLQANSCGCWPEVSIISLWTPAQGCSWQPDGFPQDGSHSLLQPGLGSDIPSCLLCYIGHTDQPWYKVGRHHRKGLEAGITGAILEAGYLRDLFHRWKIWSWERNSLPKATKNFTKFLVLQALRH